MNILIDVKLCFFIGIIVGIIGTIFISRVGCIKKIKELDTYAKLKGLLIVSIVIQSLKVILHGTVEADRVCMYLKNIISIIDNISLSYIVSFIFYYVVFAEDIKREKLYKSQMKRIIDNLFDKKNDFVRRVEMQTGETNYSIDILNRLDFDDKNFWKQEKDGNAWWYIIKWSDSIEKHIKELKEYAKNYEVIYSIIERIEGLRYEEWPYMIKENKEDVIKELDEYIQLINKLKSTPY